MGASAAAGPGLGIRCTLPAAPGQTCREGGVGGVTAHIGRPDDPDRSAPTARDSDGVPRLPVTAHDGD